MIALSMQHVAKWNFPRNRGTWWVVCVSSRRCMLARRPCAPSTAFTSTAHTTPGSRLSTPPALGPTVRLWSCRHLTVSTGVSQGKQIQAQPTYQMGRQMGREYLWVAGEGGIRGKGKRWQLGESISSSPAPDLLTLLPARPSQRKETFLHPTCWIWKVRLEAERHREITLPV